MKTFDDPFTADFFARNRQKLRDTFGGSAPIVLAANGLMQRSSDVPYRFRQDSNFWYVTGLDVPGAILVMDRIKEYVILPDLDDVQVAFDGSHKLDEYTQLSGIETFLGEKDGWKQLRARVRKSTSVATLVPPPSYSEFHRIYTNPARASLESKLTDCNQQIEFVDLRSIFSGLRSIKQPEELAAIRRAVDMTIAGVRSAAKQGLSSPFGSEYELAAFLHYSFARNGALTQAYDPVVAADANAAVIHHLYSRTKIDENSLLLLDVGAECGMYAADISRTFSFGNPSKRHIQVWQAIREVYDYALSLLKPGVDIYSYEQQVEHFMGEKLRSLGLLRIIDRPSVRKYYPHATSHFLGLDTHDVGDYHAPLRENMVITVEPGIYIPEEGIGMRLEDDVLITATGYEVLSADLSHELDARTMVLKK